MGFQLKPSRWGRQKSERHEWILGATVEKHDLGLPDHSLTAWEGVAMFIMRFHVLDIWTGLFGSEEK